MEFYAVKALAALLKPPGLFGVLLAVAAVVVRQRPGLARALCILCAATGLTLSSGGVANALLDSLSRYPPASVADVQSAQAIVILGGGVHRDIADYGGGTVSSIALERLRYGAGLATQSGLPVLVTEGASAARVPGALYMAQGLLDWGVRARWIESRALTTYDNARYAREMLAPEGISRVVLVTHAWHMPRAVAVFKQVGFQVVPAPTLVASRRHTEALDWLPDSAAFSRSVLALHEHLGGIWYRLRYRAQA